MRFDDNSDDGIKWFGFSSETGNDDSDDDSPSKDDPETDGESPDVAPEQNSEDEPEISSRDSPELQVELPDDPNFDPRNFDGPIPSAEEFARAIVHALDDEIAFLVLHDDDPEQLIKRLPRLLERLRAAMELKGPHQARVIRLIFGIPPRYWMASYRFKEWGELTRSAKSVARELDDKEITGIVLRAWGIHLALNNKAKGAQIAFDWSLEELGDSIGSHVRLLLLIEQFNVQCMDMPFDEVLKQADVLLREVRELQSLYLQGRVYHSIARYCRRFVRYEDAFSYGQQALCYYYLSSTQDWSLVIQLTMTLISVLTLKKSGTDAYRQQMMAHLDRLLQLHSKNPWLRAKFLHQRASLHYEKHEYQLVKPLVIEVAIIMKRIGDESGWARIRHVWGMTQRALGCWPQADRHLWTVSKEYEELSDDVSFVWARLSHALVAKEKGDKVRARRLLKETRNETLERLKDPLIRKKYQDEIDDHLDALDQ